EMGEIVRSRKQSIAVSDGECRRKVYDCNIVPDQPTISIRTRRGLKLTGSQNHRILSAAGDWVRLDALRVGDDVRIVGGAGLWPQVRVPLDWRAPSGR